jgi:hypothetical protein
MGARIWVIVFFIFTVACNNTEYSINNDTKNSKDSEVNLGSALANVETDKDLTNKYNFPHISDEDILIELQYVQQFLKVGVSKETIVDVFNKYNSKPLNKQSGDEPWKEGFIYSYSLTEDPFELSIDDTISNGAYEVRIKEVKDDLYVVESASREIHTLDIEMMWSDLLYLSNTFLEQRRIGLIVIVYYDYEEKIESTNILFVHGPNDNIYRLNYLKDGTVRLGINDFN